MTNLKRFREVLSYIEAHPGEWDQTTTLLDCYGHGCFGSHVRKMFNEASYEHPVDVMVRKLGVTRVEAGWLFNPRRTIDDFRNFARRSFA